MEWETHSYKPIDVQEETEEA